jgi:hypothetical protein
MIVTGISEYFLKTGINQANKALYLSLILNPRIKKNGLEAISLIQGQIININNRLYIDFQV